jgi:hypothetical protein
MTTLEKKHPLAVRWFHWINVPLLFLMLWSGLLIYWANDVYRLGLGDSTLIHFFPAAARLGRSTPGNRWCALARTALCGLIAAWSPDLNGQVACGGVR